MRRPVRDLAPVLVMSVIVLAVGLAGCSPAVPPPLVAHPVAATTPVDPATPCARESAPGTSPGPQPAPAGMKAGFDRTTNKIVLSAGQGVTLAQLSTAVDNPAALRETAPGEWLLGADLEISGTGALRIAAPDTRWLKLSTSAGRFVAVRALGGKLDISGSCVTSWDPGANKAATDVHTGRSYLLARGGGQMTIDHAELRFLGYGAVESYGMSWRLAGTTGGVTNSIISNLYYGMYSYQVGGLTVADNEIYDNIVYGIDPHTGSHDLKILRNVVHDNGKHGIILAEDCVDNLISGNIVYRNQQHGIVIYLRSNRNTVEHNESFGNLDEGINVNESSDNTIRSNRGYDNEADGIGIGQSSTGNIVEHNEIRGNKQDGLRLVSLTQQTTVRDNIIGENQRYGIYIDGDQPFTIDGNTIFHNRIGVLLTGTSTVSTSSNTLFANTTTDVKNS